MKTINQWLLDKLNSQLTTLSHCMLLTRKDGVKMGFTDHSKTLTFDGVDYQPQYATDASEMQSNARSAADNMEITGIISETGVTEQDLFKGVYDEATLDIFLVDYTNLPAIAEPGDTVWLKTFILGQFKVEDGIFRIECRSLADFLNKTIVELTSPTCRATFGDGRCTLDLAPYQNNVTITGITNNRILTLSSSFQSGYFQFGKCEFTSGNNINYTADIISHSGATITLYAKTPFSTQIGDTATITAGCLKTLAACKGFNNVINFRGEPHVPGIDKWKSGFKETV